MQQQKEPANPYSGTQVEDNRRKTPREKDLLFKCMLLVNVLGWITLLGALLVFHDARPEFISGVQAFWGIQGREHWSETLLVYLVALLVGCVMISLIVLVMKRQRNRREQDYFGVNGYVLMVLASSSLLILYFEFN
jgi:heme/copper-type cytochrome/quinol oxidase subunit 2